MKKLDGIVIQGVPQRTESMAIKKLASKLKSTCKKVIFYRSEEFLARIEAREMLKFYSQFIRKGDLCFDVGANTGKFTSVFLELGAKVVCVEPQEVCLRELHQSLGDNRNVIIVGEALGQFEGEGELMICEERALLQCLVN